MCKISDPRPWFMVVWVLLLACLIYVSDLMRWAVFPDIVIGVLGVGGSAIMAGLLLWECCWRVRN